VGGRERVGLAAQPPRDSIDGAALASMAASIVAPASIGIASGAPTHAPLRQSAPAQSASEAHASGPDAQPSVGTHCTSPDDVVGAHWKCGPQSASVAHARPHTFPAEAPEPMSTHRASSPAPSHAPGTRAHGEQTSPRAPSRSHTRATHTKPAGHAGPASQPLAPAPG
jgi:hypothetical protein